MAMYNAGVGADFGELVQTATEFVHCPQEDSGMNRTFMACSIRRGQQDLTEMNLYWIKLSQEHGAALNKLWGVVSENHGESETFWNMEKAEPGFITAGRITIPSADNQHVFLDASFMYPGLTNNFKSSRKIQEFIRESEEWKSTYWLEPEQMLNRMKRCRNSIEIKVESGKSVFFSTYNCLQKGGQKSPCTSRFMGFSVEDPDSNGGSDEFDNELGKSFVMGIGVSCREEKSNPNCGSIIFKQCIVAASPSGEENNTIPYFWMFNSAAPQTVHVLGTKQFFRDSTGQRDPPTCPQWVPKDMRHYSKVLQHLMMYRTLVCGIEGHSHAKHWKVLRSMGVGYVFAYAIALEDGTMDFVLARSKVPLSSPDNKIHSNSHQTPLGSVYAQGLDTAEEYELDPMEHMESSIWMDEPSYMTPMATNNAAPTPPVNSRGGRWYPWRVPVTHGD